MVWFFDKRFQQGICLRVSLLLFRAFITDFAKVMVGEIEV
jgi:hypothetical protein